MSHVTRRLRSPSVRIISSKRSYRSVNRTLNRQRLLESLEPRTMLAASINTGLEQLVDTKGNRLLNEDGNANASVERIAYWLNDLFGDNA